MYRDMLADARLQSTKNCTNAFIRIMAKFVQMFLLRIDFFMVARLSDEFDDTTMKESERALELGLAYLRAAGAGASVDTSVQYTQ